MNVLHNKVMAALCCLTITFTGLTLTGCGDDKEDIIPDVNPDSIVGSTPAPTDWSVPSDKDVYPMAMFIYLDASSSPVVMGAGDMIAAFMDNECHGATTISAEESGLLSSMLKVSMYTQEVATTGRTFVLKYYSAKYKRIFVSEPISFVEEDILGTYGNGYKPVWQK